MSEADACIYYVYYCSGVGVLITLYWFDNIAMQLSYMADKCLQYSPQQKVTDIFWKHEHNNKYMGNNSFHENIWQQQQRESTLW